MGRSSKIELSVILPVKDEECKIERVIGMMASQKIPMELVIVDSSHDRTPEIISKLRKKYPWINHIREFCSVGRARQIALENCSSDYVASIDADGIYPPDWGSRILSHLKSGAVLVYGPVLDPDFFWENIFWQFPLGPYGANMGFLRSAALVVGGFPDVPIAEDGALGNKLKSLGRTVFDPELKVYMRLNPFKWYASGVRNLESLIQLC